AVLNRRFPWLGRLALGPAPAAAGAPAPPRAGTCLQPAACRGGGSSFRARAPARRSAWARFRARQFWETERPRNYEPSTVRQTEQRGSFGYAVQVASKLSGASSRVRLTPCLSADEPLHRPEQLLVGRVRVDARREDRLVAGEALREPEVAARAVEVRAGGVPQRVEVEAAIEAGALLPDAEGVAQLARGEPAPEAAHEHRRARRDDFAGALAPGEELLELGSHDIGEQHLL